MNFREELDRVLAENRALIGEAAFSVSSYAEDVSIATDSPSISEWIEASNYDRMSAGSESRRSSGTISYKSGDSSIAALHRLNDALRASGSRPLPRNAEFVDLVNSCIGAMTDLQTRNRDLIAKFSQPAEPAHKAITQPTPHVNRPVVRADDESAAALSRMREEVVKLRKISQSQHMKIGSLEHQARARDAEIEKLRVFIKTKADDEARREALAMTTIREQRIGSANVHLINNSLKQIDELQRTNETLRKRNESLSVRLRMVSKEPRGELDKNREELKEEMDSLQKHVLELTSELQAAENRLKDEDHDKRSLEREVLELRDSLKISQEENQVLNDKFITQKRDNLELVGYQRICESVAKLCQVDDYESLPNGVEKLVKVVTEVAPPLDDFVSELAVRFGTRDLKLLKSRLFDLHEREPLITGLAELQGRLNVPSHEVIPSLERLVDAVDSNPIVKEVQTILNAKAASLVVPTLRSLQFKCEELTNFHCYLANEIGLRRGASLAECLRTIRSMTNPLVPVPHLQGESPMSERSVDNLAFSDEFVRVNGPN